MNDLNQEEVSRYVIVWFFLSLVSVNRRASEFNGKNCPLKASVKDCHYLVDLDTGSGSEREPRYSQMTNEWELKYQVDFLDSSR